MSKTREIITLQFGNYANYIGAHWWNIQESGFNYDPNVEPSEIDHDVLYREGVDFKGNTTFTPRLLLVDLKGSLRHMPEQGLLYGNFKNISEYDNSEKKIDKIKEDVLWDESDIEIIETEEQSTRPEFQEDIDKPDIDFNSKEYNLADNIETWTDYLYTRYHPRSINIVKEYKISAERESFDTYSNGSKLWETEQFQNDFADKIRMYIEETDSCQGFQTIFDCSNAFSGLSTKCLEHLNDEYSKTNFVIPVFSPKCLLFENSDDSMTDSIRVVNIALTYSNLIEQSSLILPLSTQERAWRQLGEARVFPMINYHSENPYHTSAILASYLETLTQRYRMKDYPSYLPGFCSDLTNYGRKLTAGAFRIPFPLRTNEDLIDCLDKLEGDVFTQISPNSCINSNYIIQSATICGIPKNRLKRPMQEAHEQMKLAAYRCDSVSQMLQLYFQCQNHASLSHVTALSKPMAIRQPFPTEIFQPCISVNGLIQDHSRTEHEKIKSVPTIATIQCSSDLADTLESLHRDASRIKIAKLHRFRESGLEDDDYAETLETLLNFKDNYEDNFEL